MCEFTQREYSCGHFRWVASQWCREYRTTHKRCEPNVTHFKYRGEERCGNCKPEAPVAWEGMIKRLEQHPQ
ncbi:hypothetical protein B0T22DRAFT_141069 [Podospora appendiculata]|uniref:Uncharacterized protein n=1 Tax=Podospora appendiculata TaxID=314037 RepID=A0AAE0X8P3_9PEZI|nr:hypothetical protein B0T22DRAFT_141069 [Podospora appendiculata]